MASASVTKWVEESGYQLGEATEKRTAEVEKKSDGVNLSAA